MKRDNRHGTFVALEAATAGRRLPDLRLWLGMTLCVCITPLLIIAVGGDDLADEPNPRSL